MLERIFEHECLTLRIRRHYWVDDREVFSVEEFNEESNSWETNYSGWQFPTFTEADNFINERIKDETR